MKKGQKMSEEHKEKIRLSKLKNKAEESKKEKAPVKEMKITVPEVKKSKEEEVERTYKLDRTIKMNGETIPKGTEMKKSDVSEQIRKFLI